MVVTGISKLKAKIFLSRGLNSVTNHLCIFQNDITDIPEQNDSILNVKNNPKKILNKNR